MRLRHAKRWLAGGAVLLALGAGALWVLWDRCGFEGCPDVDVLSGYVPEEASVVVDRKGGEVGRLFRVNREIVPLDSLPPYVPAAFVATEDRRFWEHHGIDWQRAAGAAWTNIRSRSVVEGSSTITMQLARNIFPDRLPYTQRTFGRKLAEMRVAQEIEKHYDKRQILDLYLNQIYFGHGAWGIEAAAQEYFDKPAARLTLAEGALLAGVVRSPTRLNPRDDPGAAVARRNVVLGQMVEERVVTAGAAAAARAEPLVLSRGTATPSAGRAPYFMEEVRQELEEALGGEIYTGGYVIRTTLDPVAQQAAEGELKAQLSAIERGTYGRYRHPVYRAGGTEDGAGAMPYLQGAVVVLDAASGDVLALVGGRDFQDSKFDRAVQAHRQPGSAFKPFVYGTALAQRYPPTYLLDDSPVQLVLSGGQVWAPRNFEGSYGGAITLRDALVQSRNAATVRLAEQLGVGHVVDFARSLGITDSLPAVPSLAIGAAEVTLLEMTAAYAAFATLGRRPEPRLVSAVEDRSGRVVWSRAASTQAALDPAVAFLLTDILRDVVDRGTGSAVRGAGFRGAAAGKTGTTNDATDVWFLGYTPDRVAGVWIGFDQPRPIVPGATGGRLAAPVWGRIMRRSAPVSGGAGWTPPAGVEAHGLNAAGRVVADGCPDVAVRTEFFLVGTAPAAGCGGEGGADDGAPLLGRPIPLPGHPYFGAPDSAPGADSLPWWRRWQNTPAAPGEDSAAPRPPSPDTPGASPLPRQANPPRDSERTAPPDSGLLRVPARPRPSAPKPHPDTLVPALPLPGRPAAPARPRQNPLPLPPDTGAGTPPRS